MLILVPFFGSAADDKEVAHDPDLIGTWVLEEGKALGEKLTGGAGKGGMALVFTKDKVTWKFSLTEGDKTFAGVYKVNPNRKPKEIDLSPPNGGGTREEPKYALGIYRIDGDRLTICLAADRPKSFDDQVLGRLVLKKQKEKPPQRKD